MALDQIKTNGATARRIAGGSREFRFDLLIDGQPVRRDVPVTCSAEGVWVEEERLELDSVFWVSPRAGLVLVFTRHRTLAFLGRSADLEALARAVERDSNRAAQRSLLQPLAAEVVVCTAGTAVTGHSESVDIKGLHLAVFTQQGLHLFAEDRQHSVRWPIDRVSEISAAPGEPGRAGLKLTSATVSITLRYLFPEEIRAIARVARRVPQVAPRSSSLEMFAQGEVTPPPPADLPEFAISADTLQAACLSAAAQVTIDPSLDDRFDRGYFERHFQTLGEIALGPLMLRRSAALSADSMVRAVEAMDAEQLRQDAIAAFQGAADQLLEVFRGEMDTLSAKKRLARQKGNAERTSDVESSLSVAMSDRIEALDPAFGKVLARQHLLLQRLHARDHAPPGTEETGVEEATGEWKAEVARLDSAYGTAWGEILAEIADVWSQRFIPMLKELAARRAQRLSEGARLAILATITFIVVGALALWLF